MRFLKQFWLVFVVLVVIGCTPALLHQLDEYYGVADSSRYTQPAVPVPGIPEYWHDIQPVLEQRCTVCHGCYDAPCQQNLTAWDGITRGANPDIVYDVRTFPAEPSRLFIDAQTPVQWREKNFHPVLNERQNSPEANLQGSVLYRLLELKQKNPLPQQTVLDADEFSFSLSRKQSCPAIEDMDVFEKEHPLWGMPYGLPALSRDEFTLIEKWLAAGAPSARIPALSTEVEQQIVTWEKFFNGSSLKQQLMSRYIYEHLFLAHIYFDEIDVSAKHPQVFFRLVRSSSPPGTPIQEVATRRPYDEPGVFWYRLRRDEGSIVEKTHIPYALNTARKKKWTKWFVDADYSVDALPSYEPAIASNPFIAFKDLPVRSRYLFLLDEARFSLDNFIKGPVCRGQVALGVIDDHFWVLFIDPDHQEEEITTEFLARESTNLRLPSESESRVQVFEWLKYSSLQSDYLKAKQATFGSAMANNKLTLDYLWTGDDDAALTVFRHTDSATVVNGLVGPPPKTALVMGYVLLERIHYLLVAGFDVYGPVGHQLNTRLYMDFLRMEGEANFLQLLPKDSRMAVRDYWYRDTNDNVKNYVYGDNYKLDLESGIHYQTDNPQRELFNLLATHIGKNLSQQYSLQSVKNKSLRKPLERLQQVHGEGLAVFPQNSIFRIDNEAGQAQYVTLINNSGYNNISELLGDSERRRPVEDYLTVVPGILGAYPNAFFKTTRSKLPEFIAGMESLKTNADYTVFADKFAVRRTSPDFWAFSDELHRYYKKAEPITAGMLDYNRFENR